MQTNILEYLPAVFADIREMIVHAQAERPELEALWNENENAYSDQFLYTMTENGMKRWESIIGISPLASDTLEDRRFRIISKLNSSLPYTYRMLESRLDQMCGKGGYTMRYIPETFTLFVRVALTKKNQVEDARNLIDQMIPINLILDYDLKYNSHAMLSRFTHGQLAQYTHEHLRSEVLQ